MEMVRCGNEFPHQDIDDPVRSGLLSIAIMPADISSSTCQYSDFAGFHIVADINLMVVTAEYRIQTAEIQQQYRSSVCCWRFDKASCVVAVVSHWQLAGGSSASSTIRYSIATGGVTTDTRIVVE